MTSPRVSIVLPNYNYARYLDERITSLLGQSFRDFELIIVDDASDDDSRAVIEKYRSDPRVRTLFFEINSGTVFRRWNDGAALATGEYLMFAGADDTCAANQVETLVCTLDAHPNVGVACSQSWEIDSASRRVRIKHGKPRFARNFIISGTEEAPNMLREPTIQNASAALLRRSLFERCGGFDLTFGLCADWVFWCRILRDSDLAYLAEPLNCYRKHDKTVRASTRPNADILQQYKVVDFILGAFAVSEQVRQDAWDRVANLWISKVLLEGLSGDFAQHRRIHNVASSVDPTLHRRLFRLTGQRAYGRLRRYLSRQ